MPFFFLVRCLCTYFEPLVFLENYLFFAPTLTRIEQVALDCELGCPSVSPPTPDLYILDAIDPATAYYSRLKAGLILHMIEVKLQPGDLQDSLGQLMRPIALHVREEDINLRWALEVVRTCYVFHYFIILFPYCCCCCHGVYLDRRVFVVIVSIVMVTRVLFF